MIEIGSAPLTGNNPVGMEGLEFVEYATARPESFGVVLEKLGFACIAQHRSRHVLLYRQGDMNIIVNADPESLSGTNSEPDEIVLSAVAFRVADARQAYKHMVDLGAWPIPTRAGAMELNIPGIHGVSDSILYLVDRHRDFSIYDVDFIYSQDVPRNPPAHSGMQFFGIAQYVGPNRMEDWIDFYDQLLGFKPLPYGESFGILPSGTLLQSPCGKFYLQLIGPPDETSYDVQWEECFARLALGVPDVLATVDALRQRGIEFEESRSIHVTEKGALTKMLVGKTNFELVAIKSSDS
jgi:4-hydroxyphenylpyruvate dioxygenase